MSSVNSFPPPIGIFFLAILYSHNLVIKFLGEFPHLSASHNKVVPFVSYPSYRRYDGGSSCSKGLFEPPVPGGTDHLIKLYTELESEGVPLVFAHVKDPVRDMMRAAGAEAVIHPDHVFESIHDAIEEFKQRHIA